MVKRGATLLLRRNTFNLRAFQTQDVKLVVVGGVVDTGRSKKPPALPETVDLKSGKSSALAGQSKELAQQVKLQS